MGWGWGSGGGTAGWSVINPVTAQAEGSELTAPGTTSWTITNAGFTGGTGVLFVVAAIQAAPASISGGKMDTWEYIGGGYVNLGAGPSSLNYVTVWYGSDYNNALSTNLVLTKASNWVYDIYNYQYLTLDNEIAPTMVDSLGIAWSGAENFSIEDSTNFYSGYGQLFMSVLTTDDTGPVLPTGWTEEDNTGAGGWNLNLATISSPTSGSIAASYDFSFTDAEGWANPAYCWVLVGWPGAARGGGMWHKGH